MSWRDSVDKSIKGYLEVQIRDSAKHKETISNSKNPANAQLWIAIANLSKQVFELELKFKYLEAALRETLQKSPSIAQKTTIVTQRKTTKNKKTKK